MPDARRQKARQGRAIDARPLSSGARTAGTASCPEPSTDPEVRITPSRGKRGGGGADRGYRRGGVYLRADSQAAEALATLRLAVAISGVALSLAEWRDAHEARTGARLENLDSVAFNLRRRKLVVGAKGVTRALRYAPAGMTASTAHDDPFDTLAVVVAEACARTGRAAALETIRAGLEARGLTPTSDEVSNMLETLSSAPPDGASPARLKAALEVVHDTGAHWGRERRFWRPAATEFPTPVDRGGTRAARLRMAAAAAQATLGRPVSPLELKAWARAHPLHPAATDIGAASEEKQLVRFAGTVRTLAGRDQGHRGLLENCSHPLATDGGLPLRVGVDVSSDDRVAGRYVDACAWLRPGVELNGVARLRAVAREEGSAGLATLADTREEALAFAFLASLLGDTMPVDCASGFASVATHGGWTATRADALEERVQLAARRATHAAAHLREWWRASTTSTYPRPPRWLVEAEGAVLAEEHLAVILARGRTIAFPEASRRVALAGAAGMRPLAEVEGWLRELLMPEGRPFRAVQHHLHGVRRFPNPQCESGPLYDTVRESFSVVDVGDVLARLAPETTRAPHVALLLRCASELLGAAVRDSALLRRVLDDLASHDRYHRYGVVVGLGALGVLVEPAVLAGGGDDHGALEAYALAAGLAPMTPETRAAAVAEFGALLGPHVAARLAEFTERAAAGYTISTAL